MKYKKGDLVKWNDGKHHHDNKRIESITGILDDGNGMRYQTKEVNMPKDQKAKIGIAYENYLVSA